MTLDELGKFIWTGYYKRDFMTKLWDTTWVWKLCGIQQVVEEFTGTTPGENTGKNAITQRNLIKTDKPSEKKRKTCSTIKCHNRTTDLCNSCGGMVCEKYAVKICPNCVD